VEDGSLKVADLRRAFRKAAARAHPDVQGGSDEAFRLVVEAYQQLSSGTTPTSFGYGGFGSSGAGGAHDDVEDFLSKWNSVGPTVKGWGSFEQIERDTDDDGWCDREPVLNSFVRRHDAAFEGGVSEGDLVIYRLMQSVDGLGWGLGRVVASQICYGSTGPNGLLHVQPQRIAGRSDDSVCVSDDEDADVAMTRAVDRLEVLSDVSILPDGAIRIDDGSRAAMRAFDSCMVSLGRATSIS